MKTLEEINKIREEKRKELDLRVNLKASTQEKHILVCRGTGCTSSKSPKIIENLPSSVVSPSFIFKASFAVSNNFSDPFTKQAVPKQIAILYFPFGFNVNLE